MYSKELDIQGLIDDQVMLSLGIFAQGKFKVNSFMYPKELNIQRLTNN